MKRLTGITFSIIIFFLYFFVATKGQIYTIFTIFFPKFHLILLVSMLFFGLYHLYVAKKNEKLNETLLKSMFFVIPIGVFATCLGINLFYIVAPQPDDGIHYVWIAKLISHGRLFMDLPDFYEHYHEKFLLIQNGTYTSIFLPGFSFFMAPFARLGLEFAFNPLIAGINTYLVGIHATALKNRSTGVVAMILFAFSSTHLIHGALYFPHHFGLMLILISTYIIINRPADRKNMTIAGLILAVSLFVRSQNAVYGYFGIAVFLAFKERKIKPLIFFTIPFFIFGAALLGYNFYFTGNPFLFTQDVYFNILDLSDYCHRPGFGKGCRVPYGEFLPPGGLNLEFAIWITFLRLNNFLHQISLHPLLLLFIIPAIIKQPFKNFLYYFIPLCAVFAYFLFYIEGNYWGPRYFFESGALFLIGAAYGFSEIYSYFERRKEKLYRFAAGSMKGILFAAVINFSFFIIPNLLFKHSDSDDLYKLKKTISDNKIENSIVMLPFSFAFNFTSILSVQDNPPHDKNGNLIMYSLGELLDTNIQKFYKDTEYKEIWRVLKEEDGFKAANIGFMEDDGRSRIELEGKYFPLSGMPQFVLIMFPQMPAEPFHFKPDKRLETSLMLLGILFDGRKDSFHEFEHSMKNGGNFKIELKIIATECITGFDIEINGVQRVSYIPAEKDGVEKTTFTSPLNTGRNTFKIIPHNNGCIILDYMDIALD